MIRPADASPAISDLVASTLTASGSTEVDQVTIQFPASVLQPHSAAPVRIATLWTGEVLPLIWTQSDTGASPTGIRPPENTGRYSFCSENGIHAETVFPAALASVRQPSGTTDICPTDHSVRPRSTWHPFVSGNDAPVRITETEATHTSWQRKAIDVAPPLENGLVVVTGRWPTGSVHARTDAQPESSDERLPALRFIFQVGQQTESLELRGHHNIRAVRFPNGREVKATMQTDRLLVTVRVDRQLTLSCNGIVVGQLPRLNRQLVRIEAEGHFQQSRDSKKPSNQTFSLDQPLVRRVITTTRQPTVSRGELLKSVRRVTDQDRVILNNGDELFGAVSTVGQTIRLTSRPEDPRRHRIDRSLVNAVCFGRPVPSPASPVDGTFSLIHLIPDASCTLTGIEESFWMRAAVTGVTDEGLQTAHPLLGSVTIRWPVLRRITPLFQGTYRLLDSGPYHLGNGYRKSFRRVEPDGTQLRFNVRFQSESLRRPVFLSADVAELIPSGPGTLQATPFVDEVRAGGLATQVFVNDQLIGTLNSLITTRSPSTNPERVRLRIPPGQLRPGSNSIEIRQTAARDNPDSFDDFETGAIAIEIER